MRIYLVGVGMGNPETITLEGQRAVAESQVLVGAPRLLEAFAGWKKPQKALVAAQEIADFLRGWEGEGPAAVLLSGDVGFFSGGKNLYPLLEGMEVTTICGISSLQYLSSRLGISWEDAFAVSAHGRDCDPVTQVLGHPKVFFLTGGQNTPQSLCQELCQAGLGEVRVAVGSRLSYPDEEIFQGTAGEAAERSCPALAVMLVENPKGFGRSWVNSGIWDEEFCRGEVPMTKCEVRGAAIARLRVAAGDTLWDVGAGTGSVAVELALLARRGRSYAIERSPAGWDLIQANKEKFGVKNLILVKGEAPQALEALPAPAGVFIGGSGGNLGEIVALAHQKNPRVRVVISAITVETLAKAVAALNTPRFTGVEISQITVAKSKAAGGSHMMMGQNPVFLISGEGTGEA